MTIQLEFNEAAIDELEYERYNHPHPKIQRRMEAVYLKSHGLSHEQIQDICRIGSRTTLSKYLNIYNAEGLDGLKVLNYQGQTSELNGHAASLEELFKATPPHSVAHAQQMIKDATAIVRSPTQVREFMRRLGLRYRKVGQVPGKSANPEKQAEQDAFLREELEPRLEDAKAGERFVLFMDAAHFVHGAFLGCLWSIVRIFIPTPSGRKRFNVLGAVDAIHKEILTFTNETYINSHSVCTFLTQIAQHYGPTTLPITIVLDNASYQRCWLVRNHAASLGIELLFLPSYSPHLNLIERLWRFTKKECLYSTYYASFDEFRSAISAFLLEAPTRHKDQLDSLLSLRFQSFDNVQFLPV